jgi:adenosine deaminase
VTIHVGEEGGDDRTRGDRRGRRALRPDRIGHGILAAATGADGALREREIVLEICPRRTC